MEVWCVRYRWAGQEENAFASRAIESVMFTRKEKLRCSRLTDRMAATAQRRVSGQGCAKIELHGFGARATSSPKKNRMGC